MKIQAPAPEDNFLFNSKDTAQQAATEPPSPLSKKVFYFIYFLLTGASRLCILRFNLMFVI